MASEWDSEWSRKAACKNTDPDALFVQGAAQNRVAAALIRAAAMVAALIGARLAAYTSWIAASGLASGATTAELLLVLAPRVVDAMSAPAVAPSSATGVSTRVTSGAWVETRCADRSPATSARSTPAASTPTRRPADTRR